MSVNNESTLVINKTITGYFSKKVNLLEFTWKIKQFTTYFEFLKTANDFFAIVPSSKKLYVNAKGVEEAELFHARIYYHYAHLLDSETVPKITISFFRENVGQPIWIHFKWFFVNNNSEKIQQFSDNDNQLSDWKKINVKSNERECFSLQMSAQKLIDQKEEFLKNDTLTVAVELIVFDEQVSDINPTFELKNSTRKLLSDDFSDLYLDDRKFKKDITVMVGDQKFEAHKFILITRSSYFEKCLENLKNKEKKISIPNFDPEAFEKALQFIYTDRVDDLDYLMAKKLLIASAKLNLSGLKEISVNFIYKSITNENAIELLISSHSNNEELLKELFMEYIIYNFSQLKNTEKFEDLKKSNLSLYAEVLEKYAKIGDNDEEEVSSVI